MTCSAAFRFVAFVATQKGILSVARQGILSVVRHSRGEVHSKTAGEDGVSEGSLSAGEQDSVNAESDNAIFSNICFINQNTKNKKGHLKMPCS